MRVLHLSQFYAPVVGGEERVVEDMATALSARGHDVSVATLTPTDDDRSGAIRVHRVRSSAQRVKGLYREPDRPHAPPAPDPELVVGLRRVLAEERPDVVHAHNALVYSYIPLRRFGAPPLVLSVHDYGLVCATQRLFRNGAVCSGPGPIKCAQCAMRQYGRGRGLAVLGSRSIWNAPLRASVDLFLPVSAAVAAATRLSTSRADVRVLPNFVRDAAPSIVAPAPELPPAFLLFVGDATSDKGIHVLLDAHARLRRAIPLVVVGRAYEDLGARGPGEVIVLGTLEHAAVLEVIRRSTVVVVPSLVAETFGVVALEAMAAGRPVVASRVGALPELLEDGLSGALVPPGDGAALAEALDRLLARVELREELGRAGAARAAAFSESVVVPQLEDAYRSVVAGSRHVIAAAAEQRA